MPAVLGVVIGFALQETLGNIFSGLTLQISRPFEPGDWVRIADKVGTVSTTFSVAEGSHHDGASAALLSFRKSFSDFCEAPSPASFSALS